MNLKPTRLEYELKGKDGYSFTVVCEHHDDDGPPCRRGWSATVAMESDGYASPEAAIAHLRYSAEAFLRQVKALGKDT